MLSTWSILIVKGCENTVTERVVLSSTELINSMTIARILLSILRQDLLIYVS